MGLRASQSYVMERDINIATDLPNRWPLVKTKSFCTVTISGNTLALELAGSRRQLRLECGEDASKTWKEVSPLFHFSRPHEACRNFIQPMPRKTLSVPSVFGRVRHLPPWVVPELHVACRSLYYGALPQNSSDMFLHETRLVSCPYRRCDYLFRVGRGPTSD